MIVRMNRSELGGVFEKENAWTDSRWFSFRSNSIAVFLPEFDWLAFPLVFAFNKYGRNIKAKNVKRLLQFGLKFAASHINDRRGLGREQLWEFDEDKAVTGGLDCTSHGKLDWEIRIDRATWRLLIAMEVIGDDYSFGEAHVEINLSPLASVDWPEEFEETLKKILLAASDRVVPGKTVNDLLS